MKFSDTYKYVQTVPAAVHGCNFSVVKSGGSKASTAVQDRQNGQPLVKILRTKEN
jgi:hypothetical protein